MSDMSAAKVTTVNGVEFTPEETRIARLWHNETSDEPIGKGRIPHAILTAWHEAGRPYAAPAPTVAATVFYRRVDKLGRPNGRVLEREVTRDMLPGGRGRPATISYVHAAGLDRETTIITRIVTVNGAVHSVSIDDETGEYVIRWESKADQKAVILALLRQLNEYRERAISLGADVTDIDAMTTE